MTGETSLIVEIGDRYVVGSAVSAGSFLGRVAIRSSQGRIAEIRADYRPRKAVVVDPEILLAPGFIDVQVNGGFGIELSRNPERLFELAARLPRTGVTSFLPTLPSPTAEEAAALGQNVAELEERLPQETFAADAIGIHLEGPALNPARRGAHSPERLRGVREAKAILEKARRAYLSARHNSSRHSAATHRPQSGRRPLLTMVTLAPELEGALAFIRELESMPRVVAAVGHTDGSFDVGRRAIEAGARIFTHFFNATRPLAHRDCGIGMAYLLDRKTVLTLICDGTHVEAPAVALLATLVGSRRIVLTTDSCPELGMVPENFRATLDSSKTLRGGVVPTNRCIRNFSEFAGVHLAKAIALATAVPARILGLKDRGRIAVGCRSDLVGVTPRGEVAAVIKQGLAVEYLPGTLSET